MELQSENLLLKWSVPECPLTIEYSARVLDDIRLAVTDAFFSLPRGGAEIGGLLLGTHNKGRVAIRESMSIDCEHAFGPSFVLSDRDHAKLTELLGAANWNPNLKPVGWWHSHTRSEVFLSDADLQIYNSFFPEPWQVALVLKPHTFQPTRAGFFFRDAAGAIHAEASYCEVSLEPLPIKPAGRAAPPPIEMPRVPPQVGAGRVIDIAPITEAETPVVEPTPEPSPVAEPTPKPSPVAEPAPEPTPIEVPTPAFLDSGGVAPRQQRRWVGWIAAAFGVTLAVAGYATRDRWMPSTKALPGADPSEAISLNTIDNQGELQIRWNGAAPPVRSAASGTLLVVDGSAKVNVPLDVPHVQSGAFTYRRRSDRVDVTLALTQAGGKQTRVATLFTGDPPPRPTPPPAPAVVPAPAVDPAIQQRIRAAEAANAALKLDLARQVERNKALSTQMEQLRKAIQREQQRKRLGAQAPDAGK